MAFKRYIYSDIWRRDWFLGLSRDARDAMIWSFSNDATNAAGLYRPGFAAASAALGFSLRDAVSEVETKTGRLVYLEELDLLWVPNFLRRQNASGTFLVGSVRSLFAETGSEQMLVTWLMWNRRVIRGHPPAVAKAAEHGWSVRGDGVSFLVDQDSERQFWKPPKTDTVQSVLELMGRPARRSSPTSPPSEAQQVGSDEPAVVKPKKDAPTWGKHLGRAQSLEVFALWQDRLDKKRHQFTPKRERVIRARSNEGLTNAEARLAVWGCARTTKGRSFDDGTPMEKSNYAEFEYIFRSHENVMGFVERAKAILESEGKRLSDDGTRIEDMEG